MLIGALTPLRCAPCAAPLLRVASYVRVVCVAVVLRVSVVAGCIAVSWLAGPGAHCWLCAARCSPRPEAGRRRPPVCTLPLPGAPLGAPGVAPNPSGAPGSAAGHGAAQRPALARTVFPTVYIIYQGRDRIPEQNRWTMTMRRYPRVAAREWRHFRPVSCCLEVVIRPHDECC